MKEQKPLVLKVQEALQEEAYKGIVRIDTQTMRQIDVKPGDIVEIEGSRKTVGIVDRAYPSDIGQSIIRMDGIIRRNAKTGIGENVKIKKADVREAKSVTVAPAQQGVMIQANPTIFRQGLLGRAVVKGDILSLGGSRRRRTTFSGSPFEDIFNFALDEGLMGNFGFSSLKFIVADSTPKGIPLIITENTEIQVSNKAVEIKDEKVPEVTYEDIGGLDEEIKKSKEFEMDYLTELFKLKLAHALASFRESENLTQAALAKKMNVTQQLISSIESGEDNITIATLVKFVSALGVVVTLAKKKKNQGLLEVVK